MEKYNSLKRNPDSIIYGSQVIIPQRQPDDNLEKVMKEQLQYLKRSANVQRGIAQSQINEAPYTSRQKQHKLRAGSIVNQYHNQQNSNQENSDQNIEVANKKQINTLQNKANQKIINSNNNANVNTLRQIKYNKENARINAVNGTINNKQIEDKGETQQQFDKSSLVHSPSRKRSNFSSYAVGHSFVESRYSYENQSKGSYLFKRLKEKLDESDGYSFYKDFNDKQGNSLQSSSLIPFEREQALGVNNNNNNNKIKVIKKTDNLYGSEIGNTHTQVSQYKSTLRSNKKDENNSLNNSLADQYQHDKKNSINQSPQPNSQNSNSNSNSTYRTGSGLGKINFYSTNNSINKQKRPNNSLNQRYPTLMKRNDNKQINSSIQNQSINDELNGRSSMMLKQQLKDQQQERLQQQIDQRKFNFFKKQQEIENLFQTTKEQLYENQIERMSSFGQHILKQREKYFNQQKNNQSMQLPQNDNEPIPPQYTQESLAFATQGSQYNEVYKKMSAYQFLKGEGIDNLDNPQRKKSQQKGKKKVEMIRLSQGENGSIILQGNSDKERNILSKNSYDQTNQKDAANYKSNSNRSSKNCLIKKKVKKINSRYLNQSIKNSQEYNKQEDMLKDGVSNPQLMNSNNSKNDNQQTTFRALQNHADYLDKTKENNLHQESGMIVYIPPQDDLYNLKQQKNGTNASRFTNKKAISSNNNPLSLQDKDDFEDLIDIKIYSEQNQNLFKLQSFPKIQNSKDQQESVKSGDDNDNQKSDEETENNTEEEEEESNEEDQNEEDFGDDEENDEENKNVQNSIQIKNNNFVKIKPHYIIGQLSDALNPEQQIGESRRQKKIDQYFNRKYNIDISVDEDSIRKENCNKKKKRHRKKPKRKNKKNKGKIVILGTNNRRYKIKVYKNIMGIYCAKKEVLLQSGEKSNQIKKYVN